MNNVESSSFDALLYICAPSAGQPDIDDYNSFDTPIKLSKSFQRRIKQIIKTGSPVNYVILITKRIAVIFLILISISFTCAMSISAVREAIWEKIMQWYNDYVYIQYVKPEPEAEAPTTIVEYKEPTSIPDTYDRSILQRLPNCYFIEYISSEHMITYQQHILNDYSILVTNMNTDAKQIDINGNHGLYTFYISGNKNYYDIIWNDGQYAYELYGDIDLSELIEIAENIS